MLTNNGNLFMASPVVVLGKKHSRFELNSQV
jgi:hypothetical protein